MIGLLRPYRGWIALILLFGLLGNGLSLLPPQLIGQAINQWFPAPLGWRFLEVSLGILVCSYAQSWAQIQASERVARDLRERLADRISRASYSYVRARESAKLLTHLTSDVDAIKQFVALAIPSLLSSAVLILGAAALLVHLDPVLGSLILASVPLIGFTFGLVLRRVRPLFRETREVVDRLNRVIGESVWGAALIRVLHAAASESAKFTGVNDRAYTLGQAILKNFAIMIPIVVLVSNAATLTILALGGRRVLEGRLHLGDLATFNSYLALLIFPIFVIGFMGNIISQAQAAYVRIAEVLEHSEAEPAGIRAPLQGALEVRDLELSYGERQVLKRVSFRLEAGSRTALLGPTGAGKSQLLAALLGLIEADSGQILYDGQDLKEWDLSWLRRQIAVVFQESVLLRTSLRENVAFREPIPEDVWNKAIETAELQNFLSHLPQGADTLVSERGSSLSGGQKQRVMLARALALEPRILLLDDFTARLDPHTEQAVLHNLARNYPDLTLLTVTQRIAPIQGYDQILLMMEGELLAQGSHSELLSRSSDYAQLFESQRSTNQYE